MTGQPTTPTEDATPKICSIRRSITGFGLALGLCALAIGPGGAMAQIGEPAQGRVGSERGFFEGFVEDPVEDAASEPLALRGDDVERAIWFLEDQAASFGQLAAGDTNKHAKAAWLVLEENYSAAAQTLDRLRRDRRIQLADLDDGEEAALRDSVLLVDGTLDGAWPRARLASARQVGDDDWPLISQLSSVLLQQLGSFRTLDDWTWFKRHLRQSGSLQGPAETLDPALAAELVRFAAIKDKYLLARIRTESAPSRQLAATWRARVESVAGEAEDFVLRHAAIFSPGSAAGFARAWREYAESARQAATAYAGVTFTAPPADAGRDSAAAGQANGAASRPDTLWPTLGSLIEAVPERIKSHTTLAAAPQPAAREAAAATEPEATESAESETVAAESTAPEIVASETAKPEADNAEPAVAEPESAAATSAPAETVTATPVAPETASTPAATVAEPETTQAAAPQPETAESSGSESATSESGSAEPSATGPDATDQLALTELVQRAVEEEQAQQWREALNRETFQANGVTVPIRDETASQGVQSPSAPPSTSLSSIESSVEPAAGGAEAPITAADDGAAVRLQPLQPDAKTAPGAGQLRPGLEWLQNLVERHRELIALLPVAALLLLIVLVAAWLWRTSRSRAEETLILTTALEEDPYAEGSLAAAAAARRGPAQSQWSSQQATAERDTVQHQPTERAAFRSATDRSTTARPTAADATARRAASFDDDTLDNERATEPRRRSAAARSSSEEADAADPYAQARSELERSRPTSKMSGAKATSDQAGQVKAGRSSAIAVVQAAAKQHDEAAHLAQRATMPSVEGERESGPQELITALRSGDARHFETLLEQQTGLTRRDVRDLLSKAKPDELAIACRGIGVDQLAFASMVIMIRRRYLGEAEVPPHQLSSALAAFISTSPEQARSRLQSWSMDADFTPVDGARGQGPAAGYSY